MAHLVQSSGSMPRVEISPLDDHSIGRFKIVVDGFEIGKAVCAVSVELRADSLPIVKLEIIAGKVSIDLPEAIIEALQPTGVEEVAA